jgi:dTDP-4-dehydrorhamnose 3,5-epimerase
VSIARYTPLKRIATSGGDVLHGMKRGESGFAGFGEVYFSWVAKGAIKGWKRHREMTLNLIVPLGAVQFVLTLQSGASAAEPSFEEFVLCSETRYGRLTVPPGVWMAFQGMGEGMNLVTNVANLPHDPNEVERMSLEALDYPWA